MAAFVFACAVASAQTRLLCLGDSITLGSGPGVQGGGYRYFLKQMLQARALATDFVGGLTDNPGPLDDKEHEGHGGRSTAELAEGFPGWPGARAAVAAAAPDVVLVLSGRNDPEPLNLDRLLTDYRKLVGEVVEACPQGRVIVSNMLLARTVDSFEATRAALADVAVQQAVYEQRLMGRRVEFLDAMRQCALTPEEFSDHVHLSDLGYANLARLWFRAVFRKPLAPPVGPMPWG